MRYPHKKKCVYCHVEIDDDINICDKCRKRYKRLLLERSNLINLKNYLL